MAYVVKAPNGIKMMSTGEHIPNGTLTSGGAIPPHIRRGLIEEGLLVEVDEANPPPRPRPSPRPIEATDSAIELATANGVDLANVIGTGKDGRIVVSDVREAIGGE